MKSCSYNFSIVKTLRNARGLTLEALAKETGLSIRTISDIELNKAVPSITSLMALSRCFGVSATDMFELSQKTIPTEITAQEITSAGDISNLIELKDLAIVHKKYDKETIVELKDKEVQNNPCNKVIYVFSGQATITVEGSVYKVEASTSLSFSGNLNHKIKYAPGTEVIIFYLTRDNQIARELANAHHYLTF